MIPLSPRLLLWLAVPAVTALALQGAHHAGFKAGQAEAAEQARVAAERRMDEDRAIADELIDESHRAELLAQDNAAQLQQEIARGRTALARTAGAGGCGDGAVPGAARRGAAAAGPAAPAASAVAGAGLGGAGGDGLRLTAGAVRLWDSALAGAAVPAGACRSADPADPACAAATEHTLDDAWSNHVENARRCELDRLHLKRLIAFLQAREGRAEQPLEK